MSVPSVVQWHQDKRLEPNLVKSLFGPWLCRARAGYYYAYSAAAPQPNSQAAIANEARRPVEVRVEVRLLEEARESLPQHEVLQSLSFMLHEA